MRRLFGLGNAGRIACLLGLAVGLAFAAGCGKEQRFPVSGSVQFEGRPIEVGQITFQPASQYSGDVTGGDILNGAFELEGPEGLPAGAYRVRITAVRKREGDSHAVGIAGLPPGVPEQYIPERYNDQTTLRVEVTPDGPNRFEFHLKRNE